MTSQERGGRTGGEYCPVCERFIGPAEICPYCQAESAASPLLKLLRRVALLVGVGGLALLFYTSTHREIPRIAIASIRPTMNFAYVRIVGNVTRRPYVSRKNRGRTADYISFTVDDGTGTLRVTAYRDVARTLDTEKRIPWGGDVVDVAGSLSVPADGPPKLRLQVADQLRILHPSPARKRSHPAARQRSPERGGAAVGR